MASRTRIKCYFSLNDFWHSDASRVWRSKTPTMLYLSKKTPQLPWWKLFLCILPVACCPACIKINKWKVAFTHRFLTFPCILCVKIKDTNDVCPLKKAHNSHDGRSSPRSRSIPDMFPCTWSAMAHTAGEPWEIVWHVWIIDIPLKNIHTLATTYGCSYKSPHAY